MANWTEQIVNKKQALRFIRSTLAALINDKFNEIILPLNEISRIYRHRHNTKRSVMLPSCVLRDMKNRKIMAHTFAHSYSLEEGVVILPEFYNNFYTVYLPEVYLDHLKYNYPDCYGNNKFDYCNLFAVCLGNVLHERAHQLQYSLIFKFMLSYVQENNYTLDVLAPITDLMEQQAMEMNHMVSTAILNYQEVAINRTDITVAIKEILALITSHDAVIEKSQKHLWDCVMTDMKNGMSIEDTVAKNKVLLCNFPSALLDQDQ